MFNKGFQLRFFRIPFELLFIMKRVVISLLFLSCVSSGYSQKNYGQDSPAADHNSGMASQNVLLLEKYPAEYTIEDFVQLHQGNESEKLFLHTDRVSYMQGDTIWFKAYAWYGYEQLPDTVSGVIHVELLNEKGKRVLEKKIGIKTGTSNGEFITDSTINPGKYFIRAYTNPMMNQNCGEPYYRLITINKNNENFQFECNPAIIRQTGGDSLKAGFRFFEIDPMGKLNENYRHVINYVLKIGDHYLKDSIEAINTGNHFLRIGLEGNRKQDSVAELKFSINDKSLEFEKLVKISLSENIDLQFFPEGGNLVDGIPGMIAFKATGVDGLSREVSGDIETQDEKIVAHFKSIHKGMGTFNLKPHLNTKYFAHFWYNNQKYIVPLPAVSDEGTVVSLHVNDYNNAYLLSIKQKTTSGIPPKYLIGSCYGKIWFSAHLNSFKDSCDLRLPMDMLPEGVCRLTVLGADFKPFCERLIYKNNNQRFNIEIIADSSSYDTRSKVSLLIRTTDDEGTPVQSDLSLAAVDRELSPSGEHGITSYKLLDSELKGKIEDPDSYFEPENYKFLDLLMLTNGYRRFISEYSHADSLKYTAETNFFTSGKVSYKESKLEKKFPYRNIDLSLISLTRNPYVARLHPDSTGNFRIKMPLMEGNPHFLLEAKYPKKRIFQGNITLDKPLSAAPPVILPTSNITGFAHVEYLSRMQAEKKAEIAKITIPGSMSKTLGEVVVSAKANSKMWWTNYESQATKVVDLDSLDPEGNKYKDLPELMHDEFGALIYEYSGFRTALMPSHNPYGPSMVIPIYLINGTVYCAPWEYDRLFTLASFRTDEIKKISILPPGEKITLHYQPYFYQYVGVCVSVVVIETYTKETYRGDIEGVKKFILDGLDTPRSFYSPRYEGAAKNKPDFDNRSVLLWEPSIRTDSNGEAKLNFYTGDHKTDFDIIVNGIEINSGNPGEGVIRLTMNKTSK